MKNLLNHEIDCFRRRDDHVRKRFGGVGDGTCGVFEMPSPEDPSVTLRIVASGVLGWDHVSISTDERCPTWGEMEHVKRLFFEDWETAMQLHVPPADHINYHEFCLHIWRPHKARIPRPPAEWVGPKGVSRNG